VRTVLERVKNPEHFSGLLFSFLTWRVAFYRRNSWLGLGVDVVRMDSLMRPREWRDGRELETVRAELLGEQVFFWSSKIEAKG
jgi:hypothetical protein